MPFAQFQDVHLFWNIFLVLSLSLIIFNRINQSFFFADRLFGLVCFDFQLFSSGSISVPFLYGLWSEVRSVTKSCFVWVTINSCRAKVKVSHSVTKREIERYGLLDSLRIYSLLFILYLYPLKLIRIIIGSTRFMVKEIVDYSKE